METSRRDFLKGGALVAAGLAASGAIAATGCAQQASSDSAQAEANGQTWDYEYDVVVVGYGAAGACAAIAAADAGAESVLLLEKMDEPGGNSAVCGGGFINPTDYDQAYTYCKHLFEYGNSSLDEDCLAAYVKGTMGIVDWLSDLDPDSAEYIVAMGKANYPEVEGAESIIKYWVDKEGWQATNLFAIFTKAIEERPIDVKLSTPGKVLIQNGDKEVLGIVATESGKDVNIKAKKGVVLTTGGYEYAPEMIQDFVKGNPVYAVGSPGNTGDGIRMCEAAGAALWHMTGASCSVGFKSDDYEYAMRLAGNPTSGIYVDKYGNRFINEREIETHSWLMISDYFDQEKLEYPRIPFYIVFDETERTSKKLGSDSSYYALVHEKYIWSDDNSKEVEAGWITKADTLDELASKMGFDVEKLQNSIDTFNASVDNGGVDEFGRDMSEKKSRKIENGPFYAMPMWPCFLNSQGGPRRGINGEVLDPFDNPISRLYAAGELGSVWGLVYQGSGNVAECIAYGKIAGEAAASLDAWDGTTE